MQFLESSIEKTNRGELLEAKQAGLKRAIVELEPAVMLPALTSIWKVVKLKSETHYCEFVAKESPKPLELPVRTALSKAQKLRVTEAYETEQVTEKSQSEYSEITARADDSAQIMEAVEDVPVSLPFVSAFVRSLSRE